MKSVWCSGRKFELRLRRPIAAAGLLARADRDPRLVLLIAVVGGVVGRVQERRQAVLLVGCEHLHADRRRRDAARARRRPRRAPPSAAKWRHEVPATNSIASTIDDVDEARAEVGLGHHERAGTSASSSTPRGRVAVLQPPRRGRPAKADSATISRTLPSSEAWNEKNGSWIARREPRASTPSTIDQQDARDHAAVDAVLELAQARVVDAAEQTIASDRADREVDALALDVVVRLAGDVVAPSRRRASRASAMQSRSAASASSGSNGRRSPALRRVRSVVHAAVDRGDRLSDWPLIAWPLPRDELVLVAEPLRQDLARGRRRGLGAEAALLDGHRDDDRRASGSGT